MLSSHRIPNVSVDIEVKTTNVLIDPGNGDDKVASTDNAMNFVRY